MKKTLLFLLLVAFATLVVACNYEQSTGPTGNVVSVPVVVDTQVTSDSEDDATAVVRDYEVRLKVSDDDNDLEESFFPSTFKAKKGDTVKLTFLLDEPRFVSIEGYGIAEEVQGETIEFTAHSKGTFDIVCHDCEKLAQAVLYVE